MGEGGGPACTAGKVLGVGDGRGYALLVVVLIAVAAMAHEPR